MHAVSHYGITELHFRYVMCIMRGKDRFLSSIHCALSGNKCVFICICVCARVCRLIQYITEIKIAEEKIHPAADQITLALTPYCI